ncbi:hypothetical protein N9V91_03895 [Acidimicrobiaceae bacterium]|nr:hypothetical protein [Acidimicrobiaceae bacterium]
MDSNQRNDGIYLGKMAQTKPEQSEAGRRWNPAVAKMAVLITAALAWTLAIGSSANEQVDEPDVCTTTVYEGCPSRWEYLWAAED